MPFVVVARAVEAAHKSSKPYTFSFLAFVPFFPTSTVTSEENFFFRHFRFSHAINQWDQHKGEEFQSKAFKRKSRTNDFYFSSAKIIIFLLRVFFPFSLLSYFLSVPEWYLRWSMFVWSTELVNGNQWKPMATIDIFHVCWLKSKSRQRTKRRSGKKST